MDRSDLIFWINTMWKSYLSENKVLVANNNFIRRLGGGGGKEKEMSFDP